MKKNEGKTKLVNQMLHIRQMFPGLPLGRIRYTLKDKITVV